MILEVRARRGCTARHHMMKTYLLLQQLSKPKQMRQGAQGVCRDLIYLVINGNRETNQHMLPVESFTLWFQTADGELGMAGL